MANLPQSYIRVVRDLTSYWGTYLPGRHLYVGMLFEFDDGVFVKAGDLAELPTVEIANYPVETEVPDDAVMHWTSDAVTMEVIGADLTAPGTIAAGGVRLTFGQAKQAAVICNGVRTSAYADITAVRDLLRRLRDAGHWKAGVSLVTEVIAVDSAWLCFSTERNQQAEIKASAPLALSALAAVPAEALTAIAGHGTLTASATAAKTSAICTTLPNGGTPLFRAIKFSPTWLGLGTPGLGFIKGGAEEFVEPDFPAVDAD